MSMTETTLIDPAPPTAETAVRRITLISFGFKYGQPAANTFFDVSFLRNPARDSRWTLFSRPSPEMRRFVLEQPECQAFLTTVLPLLRTLMTCDDDLRVAFGCSSGRHRSAILVEEVRRLLEGPHVNVKVIHREEALQ